MPQPASPSFGEPRQPAACADGGPADLAGRRGDVSLTQLVAEHHAELYRFAYRLCGLAADAEDLVQQTYLTAQAALAKGAAVEHPRAWLFTILRNAYLKSTRRQRPAAASDLGLEHDALAYAEPPPQGPPSVVAGETEYDTEQLQQALTDLPDEQRLVLLMFYFEDCSYAEIARRLELPAGTVMSRLSRAKQRLRTRMCALHAAATSAPRPRFLATPLAVPAAGLPIE